LAGAEVDAGDDAKVGVADVGIGSAKHRMVQPVKRFGAEREVPFLGEVEVFESGDVHGTDTRGASIESPGGGAAGVGRGAGEGGEVKEAVEAELNAAGGAGIADEVGAMGKPDEIVAKPETSQPPTDEFVEAKIVDVDEDEVVAGWGEGDLEEGAAAHGCGLAGEILGTLLSAVERRGVIDITKEIHSLTTFRRESAAFLKQLKKSHRPMILTVKGKAVAVVQDVEGNH